MIVKIQRPLFSTDASNPALIYDRTHRIKIFVPFEQCKEIFLEGEAKVYAKAKLRGNNLEILERVEDQDF